MFKKNNKFSKNYLFDFDNNKRFSDFLLNSSSFNQDKLFTELRSKYKALLLLTIKLFIGHILTFIYYFFVIKIENLTRNMFLFVISINNLLISIYVYFYCNSDNLNLNKNKSLLINEKNNDEVDSEYKIISKRIFICSNYTYISYIVVIYFYNKLVTLQELVHCSNPLLSLRILYILMIFSFLICLSVKVSFKYIAIFFIVEVYCFYEFSVKVYNIYNIEYPILKDVLICGILHFSVLAKNNSFLYDHFSIDYQKTLNYKIKTIINYYTKILNRAENCYFITMKNIDTVYYCNLSLKKLLLKFYNKKEVNNTNCNSSEKNINDEEVLIKSFFKNLIKIKSNDNTEHESNFNSNNNFLLYDSLNNTNGQQDFYNIITNLTKNRKLILQNINNYNLIGSDIQVYNNEFEYNNNYFEIYVYYPISTINNISQENEDIIEIELYNITKPKKAELIIKEQSVNKQIFLSKITHEFKTPLHGIISLIKELSENEKLINYNLISNDINNNNMFNNFYEINLINSIASNSYNNKKSIYEKFIQIESLSNYVIFLISDFTQNSKNKKNQLSIDYKYFIINSLLQFSYNILNTLLYVNSKDTYIKPTIEAKLIKNFNHFECNNKLEFDCNIDAKLTIDNIKNIEVYSDEIRVKQVFLNIISNSVKFTNYGSIKISCSIFLNDVDYNKLLSNNIIVGNNNYIEFNIEDTGCGIDENTLDKINERNFDLIEVNKLGNSFGSGLGISICSSISEKLNLDLKIYSKKEKGTKTSFKLLCSKIYLKDTECNSIIKNNSNIYNITNNYIVSCNSFKSLDKKIVQDLNNKIINKNYNVDNACLNSNDNLNDLSIYKDNSILKNNSNYFNDNFYYSRFVNSIPKNKNNFKIKHNSFLANSLDTYGKTLCNNRNLYCNTSENINKITNTNKSINIKDITRPKTNYIKNSRNFNLNYINNITNDNNINSSYDSNKTAKLKDFYFSKSLIKPFEKINKFNCKFIIERNITYTVDNIYKNYLNTILVVEDNKHLRNSLIKKIKNVLNKLRKNKVINIIQANDGVETIKYVVDDQFNGNKIRLIFSDENMNFINGSVSLNILKGLNNNGKIKLFPKFVCVTGDAEDYNKSSLLSLGFNDVVEKLNLNENYILDLINNCFFKTQVLVN